MKFPEVLKRSSNLDDWVRIGTDGTIEVRTGKVEIGQGIKTAIAMIAAEELDVAIDRIRVRSADTDLTPNEWITAGSMSVEDSGSAVRIAGATARQVLLERAAERLGVDIESLKVEDGTISSAESNEQTDYWTLQAGRLFDLQILDVPILKDPDRYRIVGRTAQRLDLRAKLTGEPAFVHDLMLDGMLHGRMIKPPVNNAQLTFCPETLDRDGVRLVHDGNFLGVVAECEHQAVVAAECLALMCRWQAPLIEPLPAGIPDYLRQAVTHSLLVVDGTPVDAPLAAHEPPMGASITLSATYYRPFQLHASLGPSAAVAYLSEGRLTVYSHSQGVELLKLALADALGLEREQVHVIHAEGAGCYGHNGADDAAMDAALLAMAVAPAPVQVKWTRVDEHCHEPVTPAAVLDLEASLDEQGRIIDWRHETYSFSHNGRPRPAKGFTNLQSAWWRAKPIPPVPRQPAMMTEVGIHRNLEPIYAFPRKRLVKQFVAHSPLRTSSLRSLGAFANVFAIESFMDELAFAAGVHPLEFRLSHLEDVRAKRVLELLAEQAPSASTMDRHGRGLAIARYKNRQTWCAVLVDVHVNDDGTVHLDRAVIAADAGLVIDPDGLINQLEGGFVQAASMALKEEVLWDHDGIVTRDWASYPILTFSEVPEIDTFLVDRRDEPALGVGEASTGPTPAAIANAIFDATGIRVRDIPFTPEQLRRAAGQVP